VLFADPAGFYAHSGDAHWESLTPFHPRRTFEYLKEGTLENTKNGGIPKMEEILACTAHTDGLNLP